MWAVASGTTRILGLQKSVPVSRVEFSASIGNVAIGPGSYECTA